MMAANRFLAKNVLHFSPTSLFKEAPKCGQIHRSWIHLASLLYDALQVRMPSLSPTMTQGTIVKWHKKEGDSLSAGDVLCDIQTDKAVLGFEVDDEGILAKILKPENSTDVQIGSLIALIVEPGADWKNVSIPHEEAAAAPAKPPPSPSAPPSFPAPSVASNVAPSTTAPKHDHPAHFGPAVRSLLEVYNVQSNQVVASGPHGHLLKGDLLKYIKEKNLKPVPIEQIKQTKPPASAAASPPRKPVTSFTSLEPTEDYTDIPLTTMRSVIAKRLTLSKTTIPHSYVSADCNMGAIMKLRKDLQAEGVKVGVNDFIIKASAVALQTFPQINAIYSGDTTQIVNSIDISIAVATESGLITPIIKDAIGLGVEEISVTMKDLASKARKGKLAPHEFQGGSFTISNLGMFGIASFSAVINPPQVAIMAVGGSRLELDTDGNVQTLMSVTLSSDGRAVEDVVAMEFLKCFKDVMENPSLMLTHHRPTNIEKLFAK